MLRYNEKAKPNKDGKFKADRFQGIDSGKIISTLTIIAQVTYPSHSPSLNKLGSL